MARNSPTLAFTLSIVGGALMLFTSFSGILGVITTNLTTKIARPDIYIRFGGDIFLGSIAVVASVLVIAAAMNLKGAPQSVKTYGKLIVVFAFIGAIPVFLMSLFGLIAVVLAIIGGVLAARFNTEFV